MRLALLLFLLPVALCRGEALNGAKMPDDVTTPVTRRSLLQEEPVGGAGGLCALPKAVGTEAALRDPVCPEATELVGTACLTNCSALSQGFRLLTYYQSSTNATACLPRCIKGATKTAEGTDESGVYSVTCGTCPPGSKWAAAASGCYPSCPATHPVAFYPEGYCSARCTALAYPISFNATHCSNRFRTAFQARLTKPLVRREMSNVERAVAAPRAQEPWLCPEGAVALFEDTAECYQCGEAGLVPELSADGMPICAAYCPPEYSQCGRYCWDSTIHYGFQAYADDQAHCTNVMDTFGGCLPTCGTETGTQDGTSAETNASG